MISARALGSKSRSAMDSAKSVPRWILRNPLRHGFCEIRSAMDSAKSAPRWILRNPFRDGFNLCLNFELLGTMTGAHMQVFLGQQGKTYVKHMLSRVSLTVYAKTCVEQIS